MKYTENEGGDTRREVDDIKGAGLQGPRRVGQVLDLLDNINIINLKK